jgi:hypothetical protein
VTAPTTHLEDALGALERAERDAVQRLDEIRVQKASIERLIGVSPSLPRATVSLEYQGLGPVEAAERLLVEAGKPLTTRQIVDGMHERGWTTKSRNAVATVYATLSNAKKKFVRTPNGEWRLVG